MRLVLRERECLAVEKDGPVAVAPAGMAVLRVLACAVCRTDAKMWRQGHRDLVLPRVLGHEIAGIEENTGQLVAVWPGQACGTCRYCRGGRENLCETMRITGFHRDGGFASQVVVPRESLVAAPPDLDPRLLTFAEPVACVLNGLGQAKSQPGRAVVYGGGVLGMLTALALQESGWQVIVIERSAGKIDRVQAFAMRNRLAVVKDTAAADFDLAINCCDSPIAFAQCLVKLAGGGSLIHFSGLEKNAEIESNLLNLIHYKELQVVGAYGPRRKEMAAAVAFCARHQGDLDLLIEKTITLSEVAAVMPHILLGEALKYVVDLTGGFVRGEEKPAFLAAEAGGIRKPARAISSSLAAIIARIGQPDREISLLAQRKVDLKTKPLGALGRLESLAVQVCAIQKTLAPQVVAKRMFVFAGDHGVVEEGVSAFPAKVTVQMVTNFLQGGAAINVFCRQYGIDLAVVDMGVNGEFADHPLLIGKKVGRGTKNFATGRAMSWDEAILAIENGAMAFLEKYTEDPCTLVGVGEMGIGNSTSAAAIICAVTGLSTLEIVGRGTGVDDRGLCRKREVIDKALALHRPQPDDALDLLSALGGFELGGICGAVLAAAAAGCGVVLDGLISTAGGLLAYLLCPSVRDYLIAGHRSVEVGQQAALARMGLSPVLDLELRLGEGTGAAITMDLIDLSCKMMREMASFEEAGVDSGGI